MRLLSTQTLRAAHPDQETISEGARDQVRLIFDAAGAI